MSETVQERTRVWVSKDTIPRELQYLQPLNASSDQMARIMVGPRQTIVVQDAASQTAAINAASLLTFTCNTLVAGSWSPPPANAGIVWEMLRAEVFETDTAGKLQIWSPVIFSAGNNNVVELAPLTNPLPCTFGAFANAGLIFNAKIPTAAYLPTDGPIPNGPQVSLGLVNTDGAATHSYKRNIACFYRYIYDIDYSKERVYVVGTLI